MTHTQPRPDFTIGGLGEVAIRCRDIGAMAAFYRDTLGLSSLPDGDRGGILFLRIAEGVAGHTVVLALFEGEVEAPGALHHLALGVTLADQQKAKAWFDRIGLPWREELFAWVGWRGVFVQDPEGNTVELVARDPSLKPA